MTDTELRELFARVLGELGESVRPKIEQLSLF